MRYFQLVVLLLICTCVSAQQARPAGGTDGIIRFRCTPSLEVNEPLYIVDGYVIEKADLNDVNPENIESISVFKDTSATALCGQRALNGVVVITTNGKHLPKADYTLTPDEIPADLFTLYEEQRFGGDQEVVYLLNGKRVKLGRLQRLDTKKISWVKVYEKKVKTALMGFPEQDIVVNVTTR